MIRGVFIAVWIVVASAATAAGQLLSDPKMTMPLPLEERNRKEIVTGKIEITTPVTRSLTDFLAITDTLKSDIANTDILQVEGLGISFRVQVERDSVFYRERNVLQLESRIAPFQTFEYDVTGLSADSVASVAHALRRMPSEGGRLYNSDQNCISYALESVFLFHGIDPRPFFANRSRPDSFRDLDAILDRFFVREETLRSADSHTAQLIIIRNTAGEPVHAFFSMQGRYWSKNGLFPYTSYTAPQLVIDRYAGGGRIEVFRLDSLALR